MPQPIPSFAPYSTTSKGLPFESLNRVSPQARERCRCPPNAADQLQGRVWVRPASDHRPRGLVSCIRMLDHAVTLVQDSRHAETSDARLKASPPEHSERVDGHDAFGARVHRPSTCPRSVAVRRRPLKGSGERASRPVTRTEAARRHAPRRLECITSEKASRAVRARQPFEAPPATPSPAKCMRRVNDSLFH